MRHTDALSGIKEDVRGFGSDGSEELVVRGIDPAVVEVADEEAHAGTNVRMKPLRAGPVPDCEAASAAGQHDGDVDLISVLNGHGELLGIGSFSVEEHLDVILELPFPIE